MQEKIVYILAVLCLFSHVAGLGFSGEDSSFSTSNQSLQLNYVDSDLNGSLTVSYFENGSLIGSSSDGSSDYAVDFDSSVSDSYEVFNLTAEASNSSNYENESRQIELRVDASPPEAETDSTVYDRNDDGSVNVSFSVNETGTGVGRVELVRNSESGEKVVDVTDDVDSENRDFEMVDENRDDIYGEEFTYTVNVEDEVGNSASFTDDFSVSPLDGTAPVVVKSTPEDGATVNNKRLGNFSVTLKDSLSELQSVNLSVQGNEVRVKNIDSEEREVNIDISNLDDMETFGADITALDNAGNNASYSISFTTNRQPPEFEGEVFPDQRFIQEEQMLGIEVSGDMEDVAKVKCFLEGEELETDDRPNNNDVYSCGRVTPSDYPDGEKTLYADVYDSVGNHQRVEIGSWIFDTRKPEITSIEVVPEHGWEDPEVNLEVRDESSEIDEVEYWFDEYGERETEDGIPDLKSVDISFMPDTDGFRDGEHNLSVRVRDQTGKWSDTEEVYYTLMKDERPVPELDYGPIEMPSDSSTTFEAELHNNGEVGLLSTDLNFSGAVRGSETVDYLPRDSSVGLEIPVSAAEDAGRYNSTLKLESESREKEFQVKTTLRATEKEKERIEEQINEFKSNLSTLKKNFSTIDKSRLSEGRIRNVRSSIQQFNSSIQRAESTMEAGNYYQMPETISKIEDVEGDADESVENLRTYRNQLKILTYLLAGLVPVLTITGIYLSYYKGFNILEELKKRLLPHLLKPYRLLGRLVPKNKAESIYRDARYSRTGTKITIVFYKVKRKIRKLMKGEGVGWKGYH